MRFGLYCTEYIRNTVGFAYAEYKRSDHAFLNTGQIGDLKKRNCIFMFNLGFIKRPDLQDRLRSNYRRAVPLRKYSKKDHFRRFNVMNGFSATIPSY
jgi:hypothetical protein